MEVYFRTKKLSASLLIRPPSKPKHPHRPSVMIHPRNPFLLRKKCLGATGISYAGGRIVLELVLVEGLRVCFGVPP